MGKQFLANVEKREWLKKVGDDLHFHVGGRPFYEPSEVERSLRANKIPASFDRWAYAYFLCKSDFYRRYDSSGEQLDYTQLRSEMHSEASSEAASRGDEILSWFVWSPGENFDHLTSVGAELSDFAGHD